MSARGTATGTARGRVLVLVRAPATSIVLELRVRGAQVVAARSFTFEPRRTVRDDG